MFFFYFILIKNFANPKPVAFQSQKQRTRLQEYFKTYKNVAVRKLISCFFLLLNNKTKDCYLCVWGSPESTSFMLMLFQAKIRCFAD